MDLSKVSELTPSQSVLGDDLFERSVSNSSGGYWSRKNTLNNLGSFIANYLQFTSQLNTNDKALVGAINELHQALANFYPDGAGPHNSIFRGKWLGETPTQEQLNTIAEGKFHDIFVGDFWSTDPDDPSKTRYRVAACDYFYNTGNEPVLTHHVVIVQDQIKFNGTLDSYHGRGGYAFASGRGYNPNNSRNLTTTQENQTEFDTSAGGNVYIPPEVCYIQAVTMSDPSVGGGTIYWELDGQADGTEKIIRIKGGNHWRSTNPNTTFSNYGIPNGTQIYVYWSNKNGDTYPSSYSLPKAKATVNSEFVSDDYIMKHPLYLTTEINNGLFEEFILKPTWVEDCQLEFMTEQMVTGSRTLGVQNCFQYEISQNNNNEYSFKNNILDTFIESSQLPLFKLCPNLISASYLQRYWVRDFMAINSNKGYENIGSNPNLYSSLGGKEMYGGCLYYGPYCQNWWGIRPYFCISAYNTPQPPTT